MCAVFAKQFLKRTKLQNLIYSLYLIIIIKREIIGPDNGRFIIEERGRSKYRNLSTEYLKRYNNIILFYQDAYYLAWTIFEAHFYKIFEGTGGEGK